MNKEQNEPTRDDNPQLKAEFDIEFADAEKARQQQIAMAKEMLDDPAAKDDMERTLATLEEGTWLKNYVLGNFQRNLPIERDKWLVAGQPVPLDANIGDLYPPQQDDKPSVTARFKNQTWKQFYGDIDNALRSAGFTGDEMPQLADKKFRRDNVDRLYKAYTALRAQGYSKYDLTR